MQRFKKLLIFWIVIFSLVSILVVNGLSYHSEQTTSVEACTLVGIEHGDTHSDPCSEGFCHLGHCSSVTFEVVSTIYLQFNFSVEFSTAAASLVERSLEGPFQPPRVT